MTLVASPLYAALLALLFLVLSARTIAYRRAHRISLGPGEDPEMLKRMRVHANCAEYAPIGVVLLVVIELQGVPIGIVHGLGLVLVIGRAVHAASVSATPQKMAGRVAGMAMTLTQIGVSALMAIGLAIGAFFA